MVRVILSSYSFADIMYVIIARIVTMKEEVRESKTTNKSFSLDILIGDSKLESMLELTLIIK